VPVRDARGVLPSSLNIRVSEAIRIKNRGAKAKGECKAKAIGRVVSKN
jgi:hypothetical protein